MITVNDEYYLDRPREEDVDALVRYLNDPVIYNNTLKIPRPYKPTDGLDYISMCNDFARKNGFFKDHFIRNKAGECIGGVGLLYDHGLDSHKSEVGYWVGRPYWGKGIMTMVLKRFAEWAFQERDLVRLAASVYTHNDASCRVLEKAGFIFEGILRCDTRKDGTYLDVKLYSRIRSDQA